MTTRRDMLLSSAGAVAAVALNNNPLEAQVATAAAAQQAGGNVLASISDYEKAAKTKMTTLAWEYISGGAGDEITLAWNHDAYGDLKLRNRVLVDVSKIDTTTKLFGQDLAHPILISPTAYHKLVHPEGEVATARGAGAAKTTMVVSSFATTKIEEVARAATSPLWFQLYVQPDREFTRDLVARVQAAGVRALVLTVDTPVLGARNRETRIGFKLPDGVTRENLVGLDARVAAATHRPPEGQIYSAVLEPRLTWKDVDWLRSISKVPVLLKGILDADDAKHAVNAGASGIIVSNHGARNLDTVPATITGATTHHRSGKRPHSGHRRWRHPSRHRRDQGACTRRQRSRCWPSLSLWLGRRRIGRRCSRDRHPQDRIRDGDGVDRSHDDRRDRSLSDLDLNAPPRFIRLEGGVGKREHGVIDAVLSRFGEHPPDDMIGFDRRA